MKIDDIKKQLEEGIEIECLKVIPRYVERKVLKGETIISDIDPYGEETWNEVETEEVVKDIVYDIFIHKKQSVQYIENRITILKKGDIKFE